MPHTSMRLVDIPSLSPKRCFYSTTATGPFIDTGVDIDDGAYRNRIYVGPTALAEMARVAGLRLIPEGEDTPVEGITAELESLAAQLAAAVAERNICVRAMQDVIQARRTAHGDTRKLLERLSAEGEEWATEALRQIRTTVKAP